MINANAAKWLDALRSGKYRQASESLRTNEGYCCLGVACDVYHQEMSSGIWVKTQSCMMIDDTPDGKWHRIPGAYWTFDESGNTNIAELSDLCKKMDVNDA